MKTFSDFVQWAGGASAAGELVNRSRHTVWRIQSGRQPLTLDIARAADEASHGLYPWDELLRADLKDAA
jgi:hypothetical protein